jgi:hypothetical protein
MGGEVKQSVGRRAPKHSLPNALRLVAVGTDVLEDVEATAGHHALGGGETTRLTQGGGLARLFTYAEICLERAMCSECCNTPP